MQTDPAPAPTTDETAIDQPATDTAPGDPADFDTVGRGMARWRRERPDIDSSGKAVVGRILRLEGVILKAVNATLAAHGLKYPAYAILATLRVEGAPYRLSPSQLQQTMLFSSGGISNLLLRLEKDGLILRRPGERGLALPSVRDEAIRQLRQLGFTVDEDIGRISALLPPPELDYPETREPLSQNGDGHGPQGEGARKGAQRAPGEDP